MAVQVDKEVMEKLMEFMLLHIKEKTQQGITYAMAFDNENDMKEDGLNLIKLLKAKGINSDGIFRALKVKNGYIFEMSMAVCRDLTIKITNAVSASNGGKTPTGDLISDIPLKRKEKDINRLAEACKRMFKDGMTVFDVALYSRNVVPTINIQGSDKKGNKVSVSYDAFALRIGDIDEVNRTLLIPKYGIKIDAVAPNEILSSKTGLRCTISLARAR